MQSLGMVWRQCERRNEPSCHNFWTSDLSEFGIWVRLRGFCKSPHPHDDEHQYQLDPCGKAFSSMALSTRITTLLNIKWADASGSQFRNTFAGPFTNTVPNRRVPIVLPGMSWISTPQLVSAVSNAGGLGILATGPLSPEQTRSVAHIHLCHWDGTPLQ